MSSDPRSLWSIVFYPSSLSLPYQYYVALLGMVVISDVRDVWSGSRVTWDGAELLWNERDLTTKNGGTTLASARVLCLDRLSRVWLRISGGLNCCQESRRGVV